MAKTRPLSVRVDDDLRKPLEALAEEDDRSVGYLVKAAIKQYLEGRQRLSETKRSARR